MSHAGSNAGAKRAIVHAGDDVHTARRALTARFTEAGLETPELDARLLIGVTLNLDLTSLIASAARQLTREEAHLIDSFGRRRLAREPVARILGVKEFWSLPLQLSADTLVPRPDTETLVEAALDMIRDERRLPGAIAIADLGTGSGAILLALLSELPDAIGYATDISLEALHTAQDNARRLRLIQRAHFIACDYGSALSGPFDLIVSNPPYIRSGDIGMLEAEVRDHEPRRALDGGADGLQAYRRIVADAGRLLAPGGALLLEVGHDQAGSVSHLIKTAGLVQPRGPVPDLAGVPRVVIGQKVAG